MTAAGRIMRSEYMHWAKTQAQARYNLAGSGVAHYPLAELPVKVEDLEINGPSQYGYAPLQKALAAHCGVSPDCVMAATGASMANHLAIAVSVKPGEAVLIEQPAYELLVSAARYLGADVRRFPRRFEDGFRIDPAKIERAITEHTRLIVLTNLHNPSSAFTEEATLRRIGEIARGVGARVLVGEVYLDAAFELAPRSAFHLGPEFISSNSLTKVYGLSGLRCGWILAAPDIIERIWRLNDLFGVIPAHAAERLSVISLAHLDRIRSRSRSLVEANREALNRFLELRDDLESARLDFGTVAFPRLKRGSVEQLCKLLREKYETTVVPGRYFEMPQHFRVGIGGDSAALAEGLARIGAALDEFHS